MAQTLIKPGLLLIILFLTGCHKEYSCENCRASNSPPPVEVPQKENDSLYVDLILDDQQIHLSDGRDGVTRQSGFPGDVPAIVITNFGWVSLGKGDHSSFVFLLSSVRSDQPPNIPNFGARFFKVGDYSYSVINPLPPPPCCTPVPMTSGASIFFTDENKMGWSSSYGLNNDSENYCTILKQEVNAAGDSLWVTGTFSCYLYNRQGEKKRATGKFRLLLT